MHLLILAVLCSRSCAPRARRRLPALDARGSAERPHFDAAASAEQALLTATDSGGYD